MGTHAACSFDLRFALYHGNHVAAHSLRDVYEHKADGPGPDDCDRVADFHTGFMQAAQHARQRLHHRRFLETYVSGDGQHVDVNNAARDTNVFGISTVVEEEVLTEIFLMA